MLSVSLALALAIGPEPATENTPPPPASELPHWRSVPPPSPEPTSKRPKVPDDGNGMITLGSILIGTGATLGLSAVGMTIAEPHPLIDYPRHIAAAGSVVGMATGGIVLTLGLVVRGQFRRNAANHDPAAPRTGNGMLLGGVGLLALGTGFTIHAVTDFADTCEASYCTPERPIAAPIQLGLALAGIAVGTGLVVGGVKRRHEYKHWAKQRVQLQPTLSVLPTSFSLGIAGRF